ncbi:GNAT family N-acetyltransferase [Streptomyces luomodiensis]|uniref:GNAT family N-acetyltransferase n=1 Tax=Streptomyces luomodiensis TaxID=3026192 RepID=A0ABY9UPD1_9ACTN|nr:GNAT family N-acetyltransferase [Streptomyces sp. SCA4-21]WNE94392.1 GNAT family N-acetyltransferase [Streptomyces sp. SCA4-21]
MSKPVKQVHLGAAFPGVKARTRPAPRRGGMSPARAATPTGVGVRTARPDEYELIADLTVEGFRSRNSAPRPQRLALMRDTPGRACAGDLLVAVDGPSGTLIGTASLLRSGSGYARLALPDEAELRLLAVLPAYRGHGAGNALLAEAIERARGWGVRALVLDTGPDNVFSQRVYHRLGFVRQYAREAHENRRREVRTAVFSHDLGPVPADGITIRLATPDEHARVARITEAAYAHDYPLAEDYRTELRAVGPRARDHEVWIAVDRSTGGILGTVATPRPGGHISRLGRAGELDFRLLAVAPEARRRGVGALLVEHVVTLARSRDLARVVMNSGALMTGAHRLYERLGFRRLPEREGLVAGGHPVYAFGLELPAPAA